MARKKHKNPTARWCYNCRGRYETYRPDRSKFCSPACRNASWREDQKPLSTFEERQIAGIHKHNPTLAGTLDWIQSHYGRTAFRSALKQESLIEFAQYG